VETVEGGGAGGGGGKGDGGGGGEGGRAPMIGESSSGHIGSLLPYDRSLLPYDRSLFPDDRSLLEGSRAPGNRESLTEQALYQYASTGI
jgi:hypothetical protein